MNLLRNHYAGMRALFGRNARNANIHEELSSFVDASIADKMGRGMSREALQEASAVPCGRHDGAALGIEAADDTVAGAAPGRRDAKQNAGKCALALSLACIGLYGVMSFNVVHRTSEIGLRMALGAGRPSVLWLVVRESLLLLTCGLALGIPAGLGASRLVRAGLFGVNPWDPLTLAAAVVLVTFVILAAAWLPVRRASRVDPMVALRCE